MTVILNELLSITTTRTTKIKAYYLLSLSRSFALYARYVVGVVVVAYLLSLSSRSRSRSRSRALIIITNYSRITTHHHLRKETLASSSLPHLSRREHDFPFRVQLRRDLLSAPVLLIEIDKNLVVALINLRLQLPIPHRFPGIIEHVVWGDDFASSTSSSFLERHRVVPSQKTRRGDFSRASRVVRVRERTGESSGGCCSCKSRRRKRSEDNHRCGQGRCHHGGFVVVVRLFISRRRRRREDENSRLFKERRLILLLRAL